MTSKQQRSLCLRIWRVLYEGHPKTSSNRGYRIVHESGGSEACLLPHASQEVWVLLRACQTCSALVEENAPLSSLIVAALRDWDEGMDAADQDGTYRTL